MKEILDESLRLLSSNFKIQKLNIKDKNKYKVGPMKFYLQQFSIEGVGNLAIMEGTAMFGLMKMDTMILTPTKKDAPLYSYDRIYALGNDTLIVEVYDTLVENSNETYQKNHQKMIDVKTMYGNDFNHDLGEHWYDSIKLPSSFSKKGKVKRQGQWFDCMFEESLKAYIQLLKEAKECNEVEKKEMNLQYVDGLFNNGGP